MKRTDHYAISEMSICHKVGSLMYEKCGMEIGSDKITLVSDVLDLI